MSETTEKYTTSNDDFDLKKCIEQECIKGGYDRLRPIIEKMAKGALEDSFTSYFKQYIELEKLSLELAQLALNYLAVQKGIAIEPPSPVTREELREELEGILKKIPANKRN